MKSDDLGDRMKDLEIREAKRCPLPGLPVMVRLDGKAFHTFTQGLERPFDLRLLSLMDHTTMHLVKETGALVGYTQSDEISLVFWGREEPFLGHRYQKMTSILASMATAFFNRYLAQVLPMKAHAMALFDARAWEVPSLEEAANAFLWRELDASKNSISMVAQSKFSHKDLQGKNSAQMQEMLFQSFGINWNDFFPRYKRGAWFRRKEVTQPFTASEIEALPLLHKARKNPNLLVTRHEVSSLEMPPFSKVTNRIEVIFHGASPITAEPL